MFQKIILVGNLGRDPQMNYTQSGTPVANFSMATNEKWTSQDGQPMEKVTWWKVSVWGRSAEACNQYLVKGKQVLVEGRVNPDPETGGPRVYQRQDGSWGAQFEITALKVQFLGGPGEGSREPKDDEAPADIDMDEIPF